MYVYFSAAAEFSDFLQLLFEFNIFSTYAISVEVLIYYRKLFCGNFSRVIFVSTGTFDCIVQNWLLFVLEDFNMKILEQSPLKVLS